MFNKKKLLTSAFCLAMPILSGGAAFAVSSEGNHGGQSTDINNTAAVQICDTRADGRSHMPSTFASIRARNIELKSFAGTETAWQRPMGTACTSITHAKTARVSRTTATRLSTQPSRDQRPRTV